MNYPFGTPSERCIREVDGRDCRSRVTWVGRACGNVYGFCARHANAAKKMQFWKGTTWEEIKPATARETGDHHGK